MLIKPANRERGMTLVETLIGIAVGVVVLLVFANLSMWTAMSMARMLNYSDLASASQKTVDMLTRDSRRANRVTSATASSLVLEDFDGSSLTYSYNANTRTFTRSKNGATPVVLLPECDALTLTLGKRNPTGAFDTFPTSTAAECKVVAVSWRCSRKLLGHYTTTERLATANIVIRKQSL